MLQTQKTKLTAKQAKPAAEVTPESPAMTTRIISLPVDLDEALEKKAQAWGTTVSDLLRLFAAAAIQGMKRRW